VFTCYVTPEEAKTYLEMFKGSDAFASFIALSHDDQLAVLMGAQLRVDRLKFKGGKSDPTQQEAFPRVINGEEVGIPDDVKLAVVLQAYSNLKIDKEVSMLQSLKDAGVSRYHLDDFDVGFDGGKSEQMRRGGLSEEAYALLLPYLYRGGPVACL
jgi:hypothetical protein